MINVLRQLEDNRSGQITIQGSLPASVLVPQACLQLGKAQTELQGSGKLVKRDGQEGWEHKLLPHHRGLDKGREAR